MFERIKKYKRYKDYFAMSTIEVKFSCLSTIVFLVIEYYLRIYNNIGEFSDSIMNLILYIISGEFCLFGMILAGITLIVSLITKSMRVYMDKYDMKNLSERILSQFEFSAFNLVIQIMYLFIAYLALGRNVQVIDKKMFLLMYALIVYHLSFNVFYILQLLGNCIQLNNIKDKCEKVEQLEKNVYEIANEIRIDYLLALVLKDKNINKYEFIQTLDEMLEKGNYKDKKQVRKYFHSYYDK